MSCKSIPLDYKVRWRGRKLKLLIILTLALMVLGGSAQVFGGPGSVIVDIVGSKADNTSIETSSAEGVVLEIVGSEASNTHIAPPAKKEPKCPHLICPPVKCPQNEDRTENQCKTKCYPWDNMHLGVDAWYNTFWYMDSPNMPKWPLI